MKNKNINSYVVAIPSYKRYNILYNQTLHTLFKNKINPSIIYIFLANKTEKKLYINSLKNIIGYKLKNSKISSKSKNSKISSKSKNSKISSKSKKSKISSKSKKSKSISNDEKEFLKNVIFVVGKKGLKNQRNFINTFFPENIHILQLDDDIKDILQLEYNKKNPKNRKKYNLSSIKNLNKFIIKSFNECLKNNIYLWGIYPVNNAYFMTPNNTTSLKFIVGPMFGIINRHNKNLKLTVDEKENVERTLQHYLVDKKVLRINSVTVKTTYFKTPGGMQSTKRNNNKRMKKALNSAEYLNKKYPHMTKIYLGKKSGWPELKLKNNT